MTDGRSPSASVLVLPWAVRLAGDGDCGLGEAGSWLLRLLCFRTTVSLQQQFSPRCLHLELVGQQISLMDLCQAPDRLDVSHHHNNNHHDHQHIYPKVQAGAVGEVK